MVADSERSYTWQQKRKALSRQLAPFRTTLLWLGGAEVAIALGNAIIPLITGRFFDTLIKPGFVAFAAFGPYPRWAWLLGLWAVIQAFTNGINVLTDRRSRLLTTEVQAGIEVRGYTHALLLPVAFHKKQRVGEIMDTIGRAGWMLESTIGTALSITPQILTLILGILIAFIIRPSLALMLLAGIVIYCIVLARTLPHTSKLHNDAFSAWRRAHGDSTDAYANVTTVKQASAETYEVAHIRDGFFGSAVPVWYRLERLWSRVNTSQRITVTLTQGGIFLYSVFLISHGQITIGDLIAFNAYAGMIIGPFVTLGNQWQTVQNALTTLAALDEIFEIPEEAYAPQDAEPLGTLRGSVSFSDVRFTYEAGQPEVLSGVSFDVFPGQVVALVGQTGAGKSTAAELISGYYFASRGTVRIDGHDIRRLNLRELRSQIAVVPQEVVLFNASIADNIRYGCPEASDEAVASAAAQAHADAFIGRFPKKYEQEVGERGVKLSVGQKQRIAIARAMLRDPKILILDEPTSALDTETEHFITQSFEALMRGRTTFIIAHRLSTVRKADLILVLEGGEIVERGTHDELIAIPDGMYRRLYSLHIGLRE